MLVTRFCSAKHHGLYKNESRLPLNSQMLSDLKPSACDDQCRLRSRLHDELNSANGARSAGASEPRLHTIRMENVSTGSGVRLRTISSGFELVETNRARLVERNLRVGTILGHRRQLLRHHEQILPLHHVLRLLEILVLVGSSEPWAHDVTGDGALFLHSRVVVLIMLCFYSQSDDIS